MKRFLKLQTADQTLNRMQDNIASSVNPVLGNPIVNGTQLVKVNLASGANVVPHGLGRNLIGWVVTRLRASATIYDTQDTNTTPASTLLLTASGACVADIYVY